MKRDKRLYPLSWEHHELLVFADSIKMALVSKHPHYQNTLTDLLKRTHKFWESIFLSHMKVECEILFSNVRKYKELHEDIQILEKEFKDCLDLHSDISNHSLDEVHLKKKLIQLAELIIHHVRYEERQLFSKIQLLLPKEEFDLLGTQLERKLPRACRSSGI